MSDNKRNGIYGNIYDLRYSVVLRLEYWTRFEEIRHRSSLLMLYMMNKLMVRRLRTELDLMAQTQLPRLHVYLISQIWELGLHLRPQILLFQSFLLPFIFHLLSPSPPASWTVNPAVNPMVLFFVVRDRRIEDV